MLPNVYEKMQYAADALHNSTTYVIAFFSALPFLSDVLEKKNTHKRSF